MRSAAAIGHLDADCFYVSAERVRDAYLGGKPVGVLGNQGACVIAKSYEMKAAGVKTGEPIWDAVKKCPQGIYLKRDFRWYEVLSRRMLDVARTLSPQVEFYSIDEFFFAVPELRPSPQAVAEAIRDRIWRQVRVPVSVGIARTKTLAKLLSDSAKPFGAAAVLDRAAEQRLLERLPVSEISGIGARRAARLAAHGIRTAWEFSRADRSFIRFLLTITGEALWYELNGDPVLPLVTQRPPHKMLSRGGSLGRPTADPYRLLGWLVRNLERLVEELEYYTVCTGYLEVWVGYQGGQARVGDAPLTTPTARFDLLLDAARFGLRRAWIPRLPATRMHLIATQLCYPGTVQRGLFEPPAEQAAAVAQVKRAVNARHGRFTLRSGATLWLPDIYRDQANDYDICDVRGKLCF